MKKSEKVVIGKYKNPEDVKATLQRLEREGYTRDDVTLYTNNDSLRTFEETYDVDMLADETKTVDDSSRESFWDKIKDMVSYDKGEESSLNDKETDLIQPYKMDIQAGYTVIALREKEDKFNDNAATLYETHDKMKSSEVKENPIEADESESFYAIYETDVEKMNKDKPYFEAPDEYESDVSGDDYSNGDDSTHP